MKFSTGEIISVGTGKLCCDIGGVYRILNFLTGENLMTHQLPRAFRACENWVRKQCPWLAELNPDTCNTETVWTWLADAEKRFGKEHELEPLPAGGYVAMDPIDEAVSMVGDPAKIIQVQL